MKTEAEIREALRHMEDSLRGAVRAQAPEAELADIARIVDLLMWVVGDGNVFQAVIDQCRSVDQERQAREKASLN